MTENTPQAAECLSRLTAELGTTSDNKKAYYRLNHFGCHPEMPCTCDEYFVYNKNGSLHQKTTSKDLAKTMVSILNAR